MGHDPGEASDFGAARASLPVMGLIGDIGAGKSTASQCLAHAGGTIIDCDKLGHVALLQPHVVQRLIERWGQKILGADGAPDRRAIAAIVFDNPAERKALEAIVFPVIGDLADAAIQQANATGQSRFIVLDAATLLEAGWRPRCDKVLYLSAPRPLRMERLLARSGWTEAELAAREAAQWPRETKLRHADAVIENAGTLAELQNHIDRLLLRWGWIPVGSPARSVVS